MSTATVEKDKAKAPLGSFINKLQPAKEEKADEPGTTGKPAVATHPVAGTVEKAESQAAETKPDASKEAAPERKDGKAAQEQDQLEKRLKDTQTWANEEHKRALKAEREAKALQERLDRIEKKIDGTYEPPATPSTEQLAYDAEMRGKIRASHRAAVRKHGEDFVMNNVWLPESPYMKLQTANPRIAERVMASDDPVQEALDVLAEEEDAKKYGRTSEEWKKAMEAELKPKITQEVLASLKTKPGPATNTLGNVRGEAERTSQKSDVPGRLDLKAVFPHGAART